MPLSATATDLDRLAALRLQLEWGADEALAEQPIDRRLAGAPLDAMPDPAFNNAPRRLLTRPEPALIAPPLAAPPSVTAGTLDELHQALAAFTGCPLRATATTTVRPAGNPAAGLVLIAEAPSADDDRIGQAFSGLPGQVLDRVLASIGLDRTTLLLTTLVPWRPPGSRAPTEAEVQACLPFVLKMLELTRPARLLLLGAAPVKTLLAGAEPLRRLRGRWHPVARSPASTLALPMLPLDQWLRSPASKRDTWTDLLSLRTELDRQV